MSLRVTKSGRVKTTVTEAEFQRQVIELAHLHGFRVAHFRPGRTKDGGWRTAVAADGAGFCDLVMIHKRDGRGIAAELKVGKNKATREQLEWLEHFAAVGFVTGVFYPADWPLIEMALR